MCAVSMVGDFYLDKWRMPQLPSPQIWPYLVPNPIGPNTLPTYAPPSPTREEFEALKREVEDMKELLKRAKAYDEANGEPNCEMDEKMDLLRRVAKAVGISLDDVIGPKS